MNNYEMTVYIGALISTIFLIVGYFLTHPKQSGEKQ